MSSNNTFENVWNVMAGVSALHLSISGVLTAYTAYKRLQTGQLGNGFSTSICADNMKTARQEITEHLPLLTSVALAAHMTGQSYTLTKTSARALIIIYVVRALARICSTVKSDIGSSDNLKKLSCFATLGEYSILALWVARVLGYLKEY